MFSTSPSIGTFTLSFLYMSMPLRASANATFCGVLTITAPVMASVCSRVRCMSLVPGGVSRMK